MGSIVAHATVVNDPTSGTIDQVQLNVPTAVEELDHLYLFVGACWFIGDGVISTPAGWSVVTEYASSGRFYVGTLFERVAGESDAHSLVTVALNQSLYASATIVACRDFTLEGASWIHGAPPALPVDLEAGDVFLAFAYAGGLLDDSGFYDQDGYFDTYAAHRMHAAYYMSTGALGGVADQAITDVDLRMWNYSDGASILHMHVYTITGVPTTPPEPEPPPPPTLPEVTTPVPALDAPVTVHFGESLNGVFADPVIDISFFQLVDLPVGGRYQLGDQLSGQPWYTFTIRDRSKSRGIISYQGETLLALLGRATPLESLILVAGQGGVPDPLDLRECLRQFLIFYGVPFVDDLPVFALRVGDQLIAPTVDAFVIQPDQENPESIYTHLERFFGPFRGYRFRANINDALEVAPPAWVDTIGLKLTVYRRRQDNDRVPVRFMAEAPWSTTRAPIVDYEGFVDGAVVSGTVGTLTQSDVSYETVAIGPYTVRVYWLSAPDSEVRLWVNPVPSDDVSVGSLFSVTFTFRPTGGGGVEQVSLTNDDLKPDEIESISADSVYNQSVLNVRRRTFQAGQTLMQAAALVLKSPTQLMAGVFGNNPPFGPMAWAPSDPGGFNTLANTAAQAGTWFWPVDPGVVIQPGTSVSVAYDVEEWAEQWSSPGTTPHDTAFKANEYSGSASLPANGTEVKLFDLQFPRETTNFAPGAYGAIGSVFGRWRAGEQPGIELRVTGRFVEFGYVPEVGPLGNTYYFLWGFQLTLNGTGTTFTEGDIESYRFGFARGVDGLWEDGADVPGLAQSQALYPNRTYTVELPYEVEPEMALAIARGIVEENLNPKTVYQLPIPGSVEDGYPVKPWHIGRGAGVPALGVSGRITGFDYTETNTPAGTTSELVVDVEVAQAVPGTPASPEGRRFRRAVYGVTTYQRGE